MNEPSAETDAIARQVVDSAFCVHAELGPGYLEAFYEEALCIELESRGIAFRRQVTIEARYRGRLIGRHRLDLVVGELVVVELKSIEALAGVHFAQVLSYLKTSGLELGLLINFNAHYLKGGLRRVVLTR